jgi:hypothetical protein
LKINWGVGITLSIILFMIISIGLIYYAFHQDVNLVRDDYYEAEVQYNDTMDKIKRTNEFKEKLNIILTTDNIELHFPIDLSQSKISGNIFLYRPSNGDKDINLPIKLDSTNSQYLTTSNLIPGLWKIKVEWNYDSTSFQNDKILMVQ